MTQMPVAAGMDAMEEGGLGEPFALNQSPADTSSDTWMRADRIAPMDTPDLFDFDSDGGGMDYQLNVPIGTSVPMHSGPISSVS